MWDERPPSVHLIWIEDIEGGGNWTNNALFCMYYILHLMYYILCTVSHLSCMCPLLVVSWSRSEPDWRNSSRSRGLATLKSGFCLRHLHLNHNIEDRSSPVFYGPNMLCKSLSISVINKGISSFSSLGTLFYWIILINISKISESGKGLQLNNLSFKLYIIYL